MRYGHIMAIVFGWYFSMSSPKEWTPEQVVISLVLGTVGVCMVGVACYDLGRQAR